MSNAYNNLISEGQNTYFSAADRVEADKAEARALDARMAASIASASAELIALIGQERAERAIKHFGSAVIALQVAKTQIAAGKCKAA